MALAVGLAHVAVYLLLTAIGLWLFARPVTLGDVSAKAYYKRGGRRRTKGRIE